MDCSLFWFFSVLGFLRDRGMELGFGHFLPIIASKVVKGRFLVDKDFSRQFQLGLVVVVQGTRTDTIVTVRGTIDKEIGTAIGAKASFSPLGRFVSFKQSFAFLKGGHVLACQCHADTSRPSTTITAMTHMRIHIIFGNQRELNRSAQALSREIHRFVLVLLTIVLMDVEKLCHS